MKITGAKKIELLLKSEFKHLKILSEFKFHPTRKWRFDFAIVEKKIAIEYEGIFSARSRHTSITGFTNDCEKYNEAVKLGWRVLRYTAENYSNIICDLKLLTEL